MCCLRYFCCLKGLVQYICCQVESLCVYILRYIHSSGVIYCAFLGWRAFDSLGVKSDIVVVRDDNWASGTHKFQDLIDSTDAKAGQRVVTNVPIASLGTKLGTQRVGSSLSIAVDPTDLRRIYVAWCDGLASSSFPYTLHIRRSDDSGQSWTGDLFSLTNTTNPGLAINANGVVGALYQELVKTNGGNRWRTHFVHSTDQFTNVTDTVLADVLDSDVGAATSVIIGDYSNLVAIGNDFYGVFSAYNEPDLSNFPVGVVYLRNHDFNTKRLLNINNSAVVPPSVDPHFVHCRMDRTIYKATKTDNSDFLRAHVSLSRTGSTVIWHYELHSHKLGSLGFFLFCPNDNFLVKNVTHGDKQASKQAR